MKTIEEIQEMLVSELCDSLDNITNFSLDYYNELLGDTSFLLAGFLEQQLKNNFNDWDIKKWIDDSLLTKVDLNGNIVSIWGIMIYGKEGINLQWTEPFYFEIVLNESRTDFIHLTLLFGDLNNSKISYEEFNQNRNIWDREYYSNDDWEASERDWKYIINTKNKFQRNSGSVTASEE